MSQATAQSLPETRQRLRAAAFAQFGRFGYDGVSMVTVARACGITKAALYWHYTSKQALYADCMRELVGVFESHLMDGLDRGSDPVEQILALFSGLATLVDDARLVDGIAGYWLKPSTAEVIQAREVLRAFETQAADLVEQILEAACADGALRLRMPVADIAQAFIALIEAIVLPLGNRAARDHRRLVAVLAHIFFTAHADAPELADRAARLAEHTL